MRITAIVAAFLIAAGLTAGAVQPAGAQDNMTAIKERTDLMKRMGGHVRKFRTLDNTADAAAAADTILEVAAMLPSKFPEGSGGGESRAKPEIWQNMDDFKSKLSALVEAAEELKAAAATGDLEATKAAAGKVGGACGGCHRVYRAKEDG